MKKLFTLLCAAIISLAALADGKTCKVKGTTGTVEVNAYQDGSKIIVDFGNDTDVDVNVNFRIGYLQYDRIYDSWLGKEVNRTKRVPPHSSSSIEINTGTKDIKDVTVKSLSGNKCEKFK